MPVVVVVVNQSLPVGVAHSGIIHKSSSVASIGEGLEKAASLTNAV